MADQEPKEWAADQLEGLLMIGKEYVKLLREPATSTGLAYAMLYYLRAELGKTTRIMGYDLPTKRNLATAKAIAEEHLTS